MEFTTQKQQLQQSRRLIRSERLALCKRAMSVVAQIGLCCFFAFAPALGTALGWLKD